MFYLFLSYAPRKYKIKRLLPQLIQYRRKLEFSSQSVHPCLIFLDTANLKLDWKWLTMTNTLAYTDTELIKAAKCFIIQAPYDPRNTIIVIKRSVGLWISTVLPLFWLKSVPGTCTWARWPSGFNVIIKLFFSSSLTKKLKWQDFPS